MKFTNDDLDGVMADLGMMKFFPGDPSTRAAIKAFLAKICPHKEALLWLGDTLINRVREWPGSAEVRGLLETKYTAADGVPDPGCTIAGFRAEDGEARSLEVNPHSRGEIGPGERQILRELTAGAAISFQPETKKPTGRKDKSAKIAAAEPQMRAPVCTCGLVEDAKGYFARVPDPACPRHTRLPAAPGCVDPKRASA